MLALFSNRSRMMSTRTAGSAAGVNAPLVSLSGLFTGWFHAPSEKGRLPMPCTGLLYQGSPPVHLCPPQTH